MENKDKTQDKYPIAAINGDYKNDDKLPDGFNLSRGIYSKYGKHSETRTSLKIDSNNNAFFSVGSNYNVQNALGGGFKIIQNGQFVYNLTCYKDSDYTEKVACDSDWDYDKGSVELNREPVKFNDWQDYEWSEERMPQTGFLAKNGQSIIGINSKGDLVLATTPGYYKPTIFGAQQKGGILMSELAQELIDNYDVKQAYRPDGGNEASIYYSSIGTKNLTIAGLLNEIPTALFVFDQNNIPYEE